MRKLTPVLTALTAFFCLFTSLRAATFPFYLQWDDASPGVTDLSSLNHAPLTAIDEPVLAADGRFYINGGADRLRFLGVNLTMAACFPDKTLADQIAARMAKFGVNIVRFHLMDASWGESIINYTGPTSRVINASAMDRLDYFISRLKAHGIYTNINLLAGRDFRAADGLYASIDTMEWKDKQTPAMFDPAMIALQKEYANQILNRVNPYTGQNYLTDIQTVFVEVCNEHGLLHAWLNGQMDILPSDYNAQLQVMWDSYLSGKYPSFAALESAWSITSPLGTEKFINGNFASGAEFPWVMELHGGAATHGVVPNGYLPGINAESITVTVTSPTDWHIQFNQAVSITGGIPFTLSFSAKASSVTQITLTLQEVNGAWQTFFTKNLDLTTSWQNFYFVFVPSATTSSARVNFSGIAETAGNYQLANLSFKQGGDIPGVNPGETDFNSVKIFLTADKSDRTEAAKLDWVDFLWNKEYDYWSEMNNYVKTTLGFQGYTIGTVIGNSTPNIMKLFDVIDSHAYWQHPNMPSGWGGPWWINNTSLAGAQDGGTIAGLAMKRVLGKPFTVTEYNHPSPSTFESEAFIFLAAYAAMQDWDAIYPYTYSDGNTNFSDNKIDNYFDLDRNPGKMMSFLPAANMFRRGDVSPANTYVTVPMTKSDEINRLPGLVQWSLIDAQQQGMNRKTGMLHRTAIVVEGSSNTPGAITPAAVPDPGTHFVSDTGELDWNASTKIFTIDSPDTKAVVGYAMGQSYNLSGIIIRPLSSMQNWASIAVTLMQGASLTSGAQKMLVTAHGLVGNTGMNYRLYPSGLSAGFPPPADTDIYVSSWGTAPTIAEGIGAEFVIPYPAANVKVYSLDSTGARMVSLPITDESGSAKFQTADTRQTLWYEVEIFASAAPTDTYTLTPTVTITPGGPTNTVTPTLTYTPTVALQMIDNFEDNNQQNMLLGYWYTYKDASSSMTPAPSGTFPIAGPGANSSSYALRAYGTIGAVNAYCGIGTQLNISAGSPAYTETDISSYTGIQFMVKGDGLNYYIKIPYTTGATSNTGFNDFKWFFTAPASWTLIQIPFSSMTQESGWGTTAILSDVLTHAKEIQWQVVGLGRAFDIYIDDIALYNASPATPTFTATNTLTIPPTVTLTRTITITPSVTLTRTQTPAATAAITPTATITRTPKPEGLLPEYKVHPMPFNAALGHTKLYFPGLADNSTVTLYNMKGEKVYSRNCGVFNGDFYIDLSSQKKQNRLVSGIYICVINKGDEVVSFKIAIIR